MHERNCCDEAANHHLPIAAAFWIIQIVSAEECSSLMQNLMQICCSARSVILNMMATQYTCSLSGVYCPFWLVQWSHHCSPMHIPVHFPWLPGYISAAQTILLLLTMARLFPDRSHMLTILDRNYIGWSKNRFMVVSTENCIFLYYYLLLIVFHMNNCKPTFAPPCIIVSFQLLSATLLWLYLKVMAFFTLLLHCYIIQIGL